MTSWDGGTLDEREYLIVRGTVQQIVYYNDENGYAVLRLAAENGAEVTATGTFPNIFHSPFRLAKSRSTSGCSLDAHCGGCLNFPFILRSGSCLSGFHSAARIAYGG